MPTDISTQLLNGLKRTPGNILGGPTDLVNLALGAVTGRGLQGAVQDPVGGSNYINKQFGLNTAPAEIPQQTLEAVTGLLSPSSSVKAGGIALATLLAQMSGAKAGVKLATGPGAKQAGMIVGAADKLGFLAVSKAKQALDAGTSGRQVFADTGVYASPFDKVLRAVISDRGAVLNPSHFTVNSEIKPNRTLGNILDHPDLFNVYPELKDIPVLTMPAKWRGEYNGYMQGGKMYINPNLGHGRDALSVVLHETQHGIQDNLGMSPGGTARQFIKDKDTIDRTKKIVDLYIKQTSVDPAANAATLNDLNVYKKILGDIDVQAFKAYRNLPAERESRFTQKQFEGILPKDYYPPDYVNKNASTAITHYDMTPEIVDLLKRLGITP